MFCILEKMNTRKEKTLETNLQILFLFEDSMYIKTHHFEGKKTPFLCEQIAMQGVWFFGAEFCQEIIISKRQ